MPLPPILKRPKRLKGVEQMVILGVTFRITITSDGFVGMSLDVMLDIWINLRDVVKKSISAEISLS